MNLFLWYLLVNIVEVLGHIPRPHRRVFATLAPNGYSHEGFTNAYSFCKKVFWVA